MKFHYLFISCQLENMDEATIANKEINKTHNFGQKNLTMEMKVLYKKKI